MKNKGLNKINNEESIKNLKKLKKKKNRKRKKIDKKKDHNVSVVKKLDIQPANVLSYLKVIIKKIKLIKELIKKKVNLILFVITVDLKNIL